ncbi:MAG: 2-C-methyl-D-erythritol 4-phosphate cytidylyltransferase [Pseudomonadota bacterium]|nr:2-C-methyl-D-erythritol 4-phosphate cytidylyltransferase [Pseudomonadota bacterium]HJO36795.1 2-C-methyl-D-erythritol 4-phosphate cytidylyltransferase [Gammaproteobacteria bacterium]
MTEPLWAIVPAAGCGRRVGGTVPKQYLPLAGASVIEHALASVLAAPGLDGVMVALATGDDRFARLPLAGDPRVHRVIGGAERAHSVLAAADALAARLPAADRAWVLVHDAARPCLHPDDLARLLACRGATPGALLACPLADTLKQAAASEAERPVVARTLPREGLWRAMTPQLFPLALLREALRAGLNAGAMPTDEADALERLGHAPVLVPGRADNLKITRPEDLALAGAVLAARGVA